MLKRLMGWLIVLPFAAVILALFVANRHSVTVMWNPTEAGVPGHGLVVPLYLLLIATFGIGAIIGGFVTWNTQRRWRRAARDRRHEARKLAAEVDRLKTTGTSVALAGR